MNFIEGPQVHHVPKEEPVLRGLVEQADDTHQMLACLRSWRYQPDIATLRTLLKDGLAEVDPEVYEQVLRFHPARRIEDKLAARQQGPRKKNRSRTR